MGYRQSSEAVGIVGEIVVVAEVATLRLEAVNLEVLRLRLHANRTALSRTILGRSKAVYFGVKSTADSRGRVHSSSARGDGVGITSNLTGLLMAKPVCLSFGVILRRIRTM